jgi:2-polyprenyl-3-methyl-5-hydroxy-6-metoxy-1,4-benzoquinol methylase
MLYCTDFFTPAQLDVLYSQMPDNTAGLPLFALQKTQASYFQFFKRYSDLTGNFLEVGPDIGLFTECAVREGHYDKFWLFEPNMAVNPALKKILEGRSHEIHTAMFDFNLIPDRSLSTVIMLHVLDHILDPQSMLIELKRKLSPSATLLFVTHDEASLLAKILGRRWPPYCLQHPHLFSPRSITTLLQRAGYRVLKVEKSINYFPLMYLAKHLLWAVGMRKISLPMLPALTGPLKLGNIITVAAVE